MTLIQLGLILFAGAFGVSVVCTGVMVSVARAIGFVQKPRDDRYNVKPVALGGGIAIVATILIVLLAGMVFERFIAAQAGWLKEEVTVHTPGFVSKTGQLAMVMACIAALFVTGLVDDKKRLGPNIKLVIQFAVAISAAFFADIRLDFFIHSKIVTSILSAIWIVLIINAFNFLDNMDGASAGIAVIVSTILFIAAAVSGQVFVGAMAILLAGTLLGFLVFNFPPAKIFMGDAGSLPMGFLIALLTLKTTYYHQAQSGGWYPVLIPLITMAVPLYDFLSVTILRLRQGKSIFNGDTQHFSHRLRKRGLSDTQTVLTLYLATLCTGVGATFLYQVNMAGAALILAQTVMILAIIAILEWTEK